MLSVIYTERHLCQMSFMLSVTIKPFMLSVIMLNVIMLNVIMLVILLNLMAPFLNMVVTLVIRHFFKHQWPCQGKTA
jgi:hypothetical protein